MDCSSKVFLGHPQFSKDTPLTCSRPKAGGAVHLPAASNQPRFLTRGDLGKHKEGFGFVPVKAGSEFKFMLALAFPGSEMSIFFSL